MLAAIGLFQWLVGSRRLGRRGMQQDSTMLAGGA
jgi:hypothetical protein